MALGAIGGCMREKGIEIRWRDMDAYGHVNHAVFVTYLEEARDELLGELLGPAYEDFVLVRLEVDYRRALTQADGEVRASSWVEGVGTSSVRTREELRTADGDLAAEARTVMVARERGAPRARPLDARERDALERAVEVAAGR